MASKLGEILVLKSSENQLFRVMFGFDFEICTVQFHRRYKK